MSLLIANDEVTLFAPSPQTDAHGWREPGEQSYWTGVGNLQEQPGITDPRMADSGGRGPHGPARDRVANLYLPDDIPVVLEGSVARCRERSYVLSQVRFVTDPSGGEWDCWAATATSVDTWPQDEQLVSVP